MTDHTTTEGTTTMQSATIDRTLSSGAFTLPASDRDKLVETLAGIDRNLDRASWSAGFIIGFCAGFTDDQYLVDEVTTAKGVRFVGTSDYDVSLARVGMLGTALGDHPGARHDYLRACGVLEGWKQGTVERSDAGECDLCEMRLLTDTEGVKCDHGTFCDEDCQASFCRRGCGWEPEFDKDAYYDGKYGA